MKRKLSIEEWEKAMELPPVVITLEMTIDRNKFLEWCLYDTTKIYRKPRHLQGDGIETRIVKVEGEDVYFIE